MERLLIVGRRFRSFAGSCAPNPGQEAVSLQDMAFTEVLFVDDPFPSVTFRTGMTSYQESLTGGHYIGRGWNGHGFSHEPWTQLDPAAHPTPQAFWIEIDGQELRSHWDWQGIEWAEKNGINHVVITLKHQVRPVTLRIHTVLDGTPVITRWLEITNTGDRPAALSQCYPWSGVLHTHGNIGRAFQTGANTHLYSVGYMIGDGWAHEGNFEWRPLPNAGYTINGRYRRARHRHPMFMVRNELTGEHFIGQMAWSAGYTFEFDLNGATDKSLEQTELFFRAGVDAPKPLRVIEPGETVRTPEVLLGMVCADFDTAVQAMHEHLRTSFLYPQPRGKSGWIEAAIGPEYEITPERVYQSIDTAAEVGAEVFFIDASWYSDLKTSWYDTVGDWNVGNRFPNGMKEFRDRVHEKCMLWGLWMEPERLGAKSITRQAHPEFIGRCYDQASHADESFAGVLDLTDPKVAGWMEDQICRVVTEQELDFFRLDANFQLGPGHCSVRDEFVENNYWRYYESLYGIFDRLRERFPDLILENCAGGGGRTDLGQVRRFSHTWVTDWQVPPRSFSITNGMTIALPPEYVDRQMIGTGMNNHLAGEFDFQNRLCLFGRPTIAGILQPPDAAANPILLGKIKDMVKLYKEFVRPMMDTGRIYHHTPTITQRDPEGIGVLELASRDRTKAIAGIFRLLGFDQQEYLLKFRGLDPSRCYKVTCGNSGSTFVTYGKDLVYAGIPIRLETPVTSELIVCEAD